MKSGQGRITVIPYTGLPKQRLNWRGTERDPVIRYPGRRSGSSPPRCYAPVPQRSGAVAKDAGNRGIQG
jgi:hypothetical protein